MKKSEAIMLMRNVKYLVVALDLACDDEDLLSQLSKLLPFEPDDLKMRVHNLLVVIDNIELHSQNDFKDR
jgi:hypothetical protein